jgi:hypothetical protein
MFAWSYAKKFDEVGGERIFSKRRGSSMSQRDAIGFRRGEKRISRKDSERSVARDMNQRVPVV